MIIRQGKVEKHLRCRRCQGRWIKHTRPGTTSAGSRGSRPLEEDCKPSGLVGHQLSDRKDGLINYETEIICTVQKALNLNKTSSYGRKE